MSVTICKLIDGELTGIDVVKKYSNLSTLQVIKEKPPSLVYYKRHAKSVDNLRRTIAKYLLHLCSWFDSSVNDIHAVDIAERILSSQKLNHLTFEDLYILGEQFKTKKSFGKLTPSVLLRSITEYAQYKLDQVLLYNTEKHLQTKDDPSLSQRWRSRGHVGHSEENIIKKINTRYKWNQNRE